MRVVPISNLEAVLQEYGGQAELARDVVYLSARGMRIRFAGKGVKIGLGHVDRLNTLGLDFVFLKEPGCDLEFDLLLDEDSRIALRAVLEDFLARCSVVLSIYLSEQGENKKLDYRFREYWQRYSNIPFNTLHRYRKVIQDLVYLVRANYSYHQVSPMPFVYTDANYRVSHAINVAIISGIIALHYGELNAERIGHIVTGALMSDAGWVDELWMGSDPSLRELFFKHSRIGCMLINETDIFGPQVGIVALEHHRYVNNSGYPDDIPEKDFYGYPRQMHLYSKIVSVAENFESLRGMYGPYKVLDAMRSFSGKLFDPKSLELLERYVAMYYVGEWLRLKDGSQVIVASPTKQGGYRCVKVRTPDGGRCDPVKEVLIADPEKDVEGPVWHMEGELVNKIKQLVSPDLLTRLEGEEHEKVE